MPNIPQPEPRPVANRYVYSTDALGHVVGLDQIPHTASIVDPANPESVFEFLDGLPEKLLPDAFRILATRIVGIEP